MTGIHAIFTVPNDPKLYNTLIEAISVCGGIFPAQKSNSQSARRVHYSPMQNKVIINIGADHMHKLLGKHSAVLALEVVDRVGAAKATAAIFRKYGYEAAIHTQAEPEFPDGFLTFVSVPALQGIVLMFWPKPELIADEVKQMTPADRDAMPQRIPWSVEDLNS